MFLDLDAELFTIFHPSALDLADTLEEVHLEVPDPYVNVPVTLTYHCTELLWMYRPVFDFVTVFAACSSLRCTFSPEWEAHCSFPASPICADNKIRLPGFCPAAAAFPKWS